MLDGNFVAIRGPHDDPSCDVVQSDGGAVVHAFDVKGRRDRVGIDGDLVQNGVLIHANVIVGTNDRTDHDGSGFGAGLPGTGDIEEVVSGIVSGSVESDVDESGTLLDDAHVKDAVESNALVELIIGEFVQLVFPLGSAVRQSIDHVAGLAVVIFPDDDVEILVVGIVERMVE